MPPASTKASIRAPILELTLDPELTTDQAEALRDIEAAFEPRERYLLTGHAGTGKTYLQQRLTKNMLAKKREVIISAPTHKAVAVLRRKLDEAKIEVVACLGACRWLWRTAMAFSCPAKPRTPG